MAKSKYIDANMASYEVVWLGTSLESCLSSFGYDSDILRQKEWDPIDREFHVPRKFQPY